MFKKLNELHLLSFIFLIYIISLLVFIPRHEHWADEAQSWLLARDSNLFDLLWKNLRYEGTPGLWHIILMIPSRIFSYNVLSYLSGGIASIGIYLILFKSPFPIWIRILLPFSYFLFFQYVIVARSYVLLIPILFGIATLYKEKFEKPYLFILLLVLLANVSLHGSIFAFAIMVDNLLDVLSNRKTLSKKQIKTQAIIYLLFLCCGLFIIFQLNPPANLSFSPEGFNFTWQHFHEIRKMIAVDVFTEQSYLSYPILIISMIWFILNGRFLLFFIGWFLLLVLFTYYYNAWHQGTAFLFYIFVCWLSFQHKKNAFSIPFVKPIVSTALLLVLTFNIYWNVVALKNDYAGNYSASKDLAEYISDNGYEDKNIFAYRFWPVAVQPYFKQNIYSNSRYSDSKSYWHWTKSNDYVDDFELVLSRNPDMIIFPKPHLYAVPETIEGYQRTEREFVGEVYWKDRIQEYVKFVVWVKE